MNECVESFCRSRGWDWDHCVSLFLESSLVLTVVLFPKNKQQPVSWVPTKTCPRMLPNGISTDLASAKDIVVEIAIRKILSSSMSLSRNPLRNCMKTEKTPFRSMNPHWKSLRRNTTMSLSIFMPGASCVLGKSFFPRTILS
jgi:hypothetical protein